MSESASLLHEAVAQRELAVSPAAPPSASSIWVGALGVAAALAAIALLQSWVAPGWTKAAAVTGIVAAVMIATDALTHQLRGQPWGLVERPVRSVNLIRVGQKLFGFWLTVGGLAATYALLPVFAQESFEPFRDVALATLPAVAAIAPFYIAYVDRRQHEPNDAYVQLASLFAGVRPDDWTALRQHALGWIIKGFFLPLMFGYVTGDLAGLWSGPLLPAGDFEKIFGRFVDLFYLLDVLFAAITYTLTLRVFDSHIRSVEPTVAGWVVCLLCYPPFNAITGRFFPYDQDKLFWGRVFAPWPALYAVWGSTILLLVFIYAWSTAAFGLRFSNLTNRGIITNGPYRWSKHPAYISKNLSWWLISVPFIAGAGWQQAVQSCLLLSGVNLIYFLRAKTEERHLSHDPAYCDYAGFIARRGLFATFRRATSRAR